MKGAIPGQAPSSCSVDPSVKHRNMVKEKRAVLAEPEVESQRPEMWDRCWASSQGNSLSNILVPRKGLVPR